jgi:hypothetical protein
MSSKRSAASAAGGRAAADVRPYESCARAAADEPNRVFLLSPANVSGRRGRMLMAERAQFALAAQLRTEGAPIGDVFSFLSGLYFRGKLAYARAFARPPDPSSELVAGGVLVITPSAGLRGASTPVTVAALRAFAEVDVHPANARYRGPLEASARAVRDEIGPECEVVLLGSIASPKYVDVLLEIFGERLRFPIAFIGRGDMSRGGLMLRQVTAGEELEYAAVAGAVRHGPRPPRLAPLRRGR